MKIVFISAIVIAVLAISAKMGLFNGDKTVYHESFTSSSGDEFDVKIVHLDKASPCYDIKIKNEYNNSSLEYVSYEKNYNDFVPQDAFSLWTDDNNELFWICENNDNDYIVYIKQGSKDRLIVGCTPRFDDTASTILNSRFLDKIESPYFDKEKWEKYINNIKT